MAEQSAAVNGFDELKRLPKALHDLCQPLTTLQCRLEMASVLGTDAAYREAVELGLGECSRLLDAVESMRELVRAAAQGAE
jgi:signal transduction histidine kinase